MSYKLMHLFFVAFAGRARASIELRSMAMLFLRKMSGIPWVARVTNNFCLAKANESRTFVSSYKKDSVLRSYNENRTL